ncbi:hypothetical protein GCM10027299_31670 [Larkinella ripae]
MSHDGCTDCCFTGRKAANGWFGTPKNNRRIAKATETGVSFDTNSFLPSRMVIRPAALETVA